jgi:hypothetical protein
VRGYPYRPRGSVRAHDASTAGVVITVLIPRETTTGVRMSESDDLPVPMPTDDDERRNRELMHLVQDAVLKDKPYGEEKCGNCLYFFNHDESIAYCWHPKIRVLVGHDWWCQWWEEIPEEMR